MDSGFPAIHTPVDMPRRASPPSDPPPRRPSLRVHLSPPALQDSDHPLTDSPTDIDSASHSTCAPKVDCADNIRDADNTANEDRPSVSASESEDSASPGSSPTDSTCSAPDWSGGSVAEHRPERILPGRDLPYNLRPLLPDNLDPNPSAPIHTIPQFDPNVRYTVHAGQCKFGFGEKVPLGWVRVIHPAGQPYFWNEEHNAVTLEWMPDSVVAKHVNRTLTYVAHQIEHWDGEPLPKDRQIVISLEPTPNATTDYAALYYIASPRYETIFWLAEYNLDWEIGLMLQAQLEPQMLGIYLKYQFYKHWDNFPDIQTVSRCQIRRWQMILENALADVRFSKTSTVNYNVDKLQEMIEMVHRMYSRASRAAARDKKKAEKDGKDKKDYKVKARAPKKPDLSVEGEWLPGRMMQHFYQDRFLNLYSQRGARVDRLQSVFGKSPGDIPKSWYIRILGLLLFRAPNNHLDELNQMWVDTVLSRKVWKKRVKALLSDWTEQRVLATILLTANMSFLSIDGPSPDGFTKVMCFLSVISSCAAFVLITALERRIRRIQKNIDLQAAQNWLQLLNNSKIGLEILAVLLGLPYGFTVWSIIFFCISFLSYCMDDVKSPTGITVGTIFGIHFIIVVWALWVSMEKRKPIQDHGQMPKVVFTKVAKASRSASRALSGPIRRMSTKAWQTTQRSLSFAIQQNGQDKNELPLYRRSTQLPPNGSIA
ncbi:uncharacterized protein SCHCODRAFT_02634849 [Schizophyllum commune H4-8]|nr:uncharacterized protein SCHCODRAFT_02634849 [Schizophyllum commune H4-8]KAI5889541.1 hypothetical protein SCHCODRAFT_02634849 [Schizophyllum commune H4-8]